MIGRAHNTQGQRILRGDIIAEAFSSGDLRQSVDAGHRNADTADRPFGAGANVHDRVNDLAITGAAAQNTAKGIHHGFFVRACLLAEQAYRRDHHARRANSALGGLMALKGGCKRLADVVILREPGLGVDRCAFHLPKRGCAGADGIAVDQDGAGAAVARIAADLDVFRAGPFAQGIGQAFGRRPIHADRLAVEVKGNALHLVHISQCHGHFPSCAAIRTARAISSRAAASR